MANQHDDEPPDEIRYGLEEALSLLADLEDARDALIQGGHLIVVVAVENQIRALSRRLHFGDEGNAHG